MPAKVEKSSGERKHAGDEVTTFFRGWKLTLPSPLSSNDKMALAAGKTLVGQWHDAPDAPAALAISFVLLAGGWLFIADTIRGTPAGPDPFEEQALAKSVPSNGTEKPERQIADEKPGTSATTATEQDLANRNQVYLDLMKLKDEERALELRTKWTPDAGAEEIIRDLESEIDDICTGPEGWLDPETSSKAIESFRGEVKAKKDAVDKLRGAEIRGRFEEKVAERKAFEAEHAMFLQSPKAFTKEREKAKTAGLTKADAEKRIDGLKPTLEPVISAAAKEFATPLIPINHPPTPEKPKAEAVTKLEALGSVMPERGPVPVLPEKLLLDLAAEGFEWGGSGDQSRKGKEKNTREALVGYQVAKVAKSKARREEALDAIVQLGWFLNLKVVAEASAT